VTSGLPVDLALPPEPLQPSRWAVVWWVDGQRQEAFFRDQPGADAYAYKHHGQVVPLANLVPWPARPD